MKIFDLEHFLKSLYKHYYPYRNVRICNYRKKTVTGGRIIHKGVSKKLAVLACS